MNWRTRMWWTIHNVIAHPMLALWPWSQADRFHDWTWRKAVEHGEPEETDELERRAIEIRRLRWLLSEARVAANPHIFNADGTLIGKIRSIKLTGQLEED